MKFICKQLRLSDTWFQTGFVAVLLGGINAAFFLWPDANFQRNVFLVLLINSFLLTFVFSNIRVWMTPQNDVRLTYTIFGIIPWRSCSIPHENLLHLTARRISDDESWENCATDLSWTEENLKGILVTKSTTILQRRQGLDVSVAESKQVAKKLRIKFVDDTKKKRGSAKQRSEFFEPDF